MILKNAEKCDLAHQNRSRYSRYFDMLKFEPKNVFWYFDDTLEVQILVLEHLQPDLGGCVSLERSDGLLLQDHALGLSGKILELPSLHRVTEESVMSHLSCTLRDTEFSSIYIISHFVTFFFVVVTSATLAIVAFDTAENEPLKIWRDFISLSTGALLSSWLHRPRRARTNGATCLDHNSSRSTNFSLIRIPLESDWRDITVGKLVNRIGSHFCHQKSIENCASASAQPSRNCCWNCRSVLRVLSSESAPQELPTCFDHTFSTEY